MGVLYPDGVGPQAWKREGVGQAWYQQGEGQGVVCWERPLSLLHGKVVGHRTVVVEGECELSLTRHP